MQTEMASKKTKSKIVRVGRLKIPVSVTVLKKGITVATARNNAAYGVSLGVGVRSLHENKKTNGARHFCEHLIFKGAEGVTQQALIELLEFESIRWDAETDAEHILYCYNTASWQSAARIFPMYAKAIAYPAFTQEDVVREAGNFATELRRRFDDIVYYARDKAHELLFEGRQVGLPFAGIEEVVARLTSNELHRLHAIHHTPKRLVVIGVGHMNHEAVVKLASEAFHTLPEKRIIVAYPIEETPKRGIRHFQEERISNKSSQLVLGFNVSQVLSSKEDLPVLRLAVSILGNGAASRLRYALQEHHGIGRDTNAFLDISRSYAVAYIETDCRHHEELTDAEHAIKTEIARLQNESVSANELAGHRKKLRMEMRDDADRLDDLRSELFSQVLAGTPTSIFSSYSAFPKVTASAIKRVAQKYFDLSNHVVVKILGKNV